MEAAIWSPSGSNAQAGEFIMVENDDDLKKIKTFSPGIFRESGSNNNCLQRFEKSIRNLR